VVGEKSREQKDKEENTFGLVDDEVIEPLHNG
jgi:hypothetical protein